MVLLHRHQVSVGADIVGFVADTHMLAVFRALVLNPGSIDLPPVRLGDRPRPGQCVIDRGDLVLEELWIVRVEEDPLLDHTLVVEMQRQTGRLIIARAPEPSGLDLKLLEAAVFVGLDPLADRVAGKLLCVSKSAGQVRPSV